MHSKPIQAEQEATEVDDRPKCGNDVINNGSYSVCQRARQNTYGSSQGVWIGRYLKSLFFSSHFKSKESKLSLQVLPIIEYLHVYLHEY